MSATEAQYVPIVDEEQQIAYDESLARRLAKEESANIGPPPVAVRYDSPYYQPYPTYYNRSWLGTPIYRERPVIVVQDDPDGFFLWMWACLFLWLFMILLLIIPLSIYYSQ